MRERRRVVLRGLLDSAKNPAVQAKQPVLLAFRSSTPFITFTTFTVCLTIFTDFFLYGLIVPVTPFSLSVQVQ